MIECQGEVVGIKLLVVAVATSTAYSGKIEISTVIGPMGLGEEADSNLNLPRDHRDGSRGISCHRARIRPPVVDARALVFIRITSPAYVNLIQPDEVLAALLLPESFLDGHGRFLRDNVRRFWQHRCLLCSFGFEFI